MDGGINAKRKELALVILEKERGLFRKREKYGVRFREGGTKKRKARD